MKVVLSFDASVKQVEKDKLNRCAALMEMVINSEAFKKKVLNHTYSIRKSSGSLWWKKSSVETIRGFAWNNDLSRQGVYDFIMTGSERLSPDKDGECDLFIDIEAGSTGVLGWTNPHTKWQWISKWFFDKATVAELCGNLMHEWLHKQGFTHAYNSTTERPYTVVYAIGYIMRDLVQLYLSSGRI